MWPFTSAYPEQTAADVDGKTFDYIIVGGGTAACVIASRLSEDPSVSVLLISRGKVRDEWFYNIPLTAQMLLHNAPQAIRLKAEPDERWAGQEVDAYTSQALGGASRVNGLMLTRGTPGMYDIWAELGNDEWSWEKCQPYFCKMENASFLPGGEARKKGRGYDGPLVLRHMPFVFGVDEYWDATAEDVGLPVSRDANDPASPAMGIYNIDTMIDLDGLRLSSQRAYLPKSVAESRRGHLTICSGAAATKLEISEDGATVTGVHLVDVSSKKTTRQCFVKARREVIVSCGAFFSPQILQLSGVGPKKELETHKIPVVRDLPGVGANLKDHVSFAVVFETKPSDSNHALMQPLFLIWHIILWFVFKTGIFASTTTKQCMWLRSDAIDDETMQVQHRDADGHDYLDAKLIRNVPDIEAILTGAAVDHEWVGGRGYYAMYMTLTQPHSVGRMALASSDPLALPKMHHPFLTDDRDWLIARKAARFAMHTIERFRTKGYSHETVWHRAPGMKTGGTEGSWKTATDKDIDEFIRKRLCSTLHLASTCRMAPEEDGGVVGQDLKVHGFKNLRVADASVFPKITCAHTVAPTFMVGERCADFIKQSWA